MCNTTVCVGIASCQWLVGLFLESKGFFQPSDGALQHAMLVGMLLYASTFGLVAHLLGVLYVLSWNLLTADQPLTVPLGLLDRRISSSSTLCRRF